MFRDAFGKCWEQATQQVVNPVVQHVRNAGHAVHNAVKPAQRAVHHAFHHAQHAIHTVAHVAPVLVAVACPQSDWIRHQLAALPPTAREVVVTPPASAERGPVAGGFVQPNGGFVEIPGARIPVSAFLPQPEFSGISPTEKISPGMIPTGKTRTEITPGETVNTPEPVSLAIFGVGLAGLAFARSKSRRPNSSVAKSPKGQPAL